jgi:hypothetical protein
MKMQEKALFNLLRMNWLEDPKIAVKPWQVEDYRSLSTKELLKRLKAFGIPQTEAELKQYIDNCESPEELVECLWLDDSDMEGQDQAYLVLFELWRRIAPQKKSISIFFDELDHLIELYDIGKLDQPEKLDQALSELEDLLDRNVDEGEDPKETFAAVSTYCAHDLETFLYDFISEQIQAEDPLYASELLDAFDEFLPHHLRFDFLRAQLFSLTDLEDANRMMSGILEELQENEDPELLFDMVTFLVSHNDPKLFRQAACQLLPLLEKEEDFQDLIALASDYFRLLENEREHQLFEEMLQKRANKGKNAPLDPKDKDLFKKLCS